MPRVAPQEGASAFTCVRLRSHSFIMQICVGLLDGGPDTTNINIQPVQIFFYIGWVYVILTLT